MASSPEQNASQDLVSKALLQRLVQAVQRQWTASAGLLFSTTTPVVSVTDQAKPLPRSGDQRRHPRVHLKNTTVHVTDGCLFATARIDNISFAGICLSDLPEQLYSSASRLTVFSSDNPGLPVLQVQPCWQNTGWGGKSIGATILNISDAWRLFFVHTAGRLEA